VVSSNPSLAPFPWYYHFYSVRDCDHKKSLRCRNDAHWPHCVRWGPSSPSPKGHSPTQFSAHICCGQMATWIKMSLGMELGLSPGDFMLDGDPALPSPKRGQTSLPQFSAHFYCGKTAACIKMPFGMEVRWEPSPPKFSAHVYYGRPM